MVRYLSLDPAIRNLAFAKLNINDKEISELDLGMFDLAGNKKVKHCKFDDLINNLIKALDMIVIDDVDIILIENQPSKLNQTSKSLSICMYTYFKMKNKDVKLISPSRKLSNKEKNKLSYRERKGESVKECFNLIKMTDKLRIQEYNKQDDICDCILQAYAYHIKEK